MQLWLTVVDPSKLIGPVDCAVEAESAVELGEVRDRLLAAVGGADGALFCDGAALPDSSPLGRSPLVQGAVLTVGVPIFGQPRGLLELHVTGGPDAGSIHRLGPGEHGVGRAVEATIRVDDPDVSRLHAVLRVGPESTTVHDLDSTNGTTVDGEAVGRDGGPLRPGQVLRVGESELRLVLPELPPVSCREVGDGALELNRPPRLLATSPSTVVTMPAPTTAREPSRLPVIAMLLPLVAGLALVAITGSPTYLLFVLLSPLMILGNFLSDRVGGRRRAREQRRDHEEVTARALARISDAVDDETRVLHERHPDAATLLQSAAGPRPRLWERRREDADFLDVRIGLGDLPASLEVRHPGAPADDRDEEAPRLTSVPVVVPLGVVGVLGVAGPRPRALALGRSLLAQLAGWHSPRHLGLVVLVDDPARGGEWEWARGLPHLRPVSGEDTELLVGLGPAQVGARVDELLEVLDRRLAAAERHALASDAGRPVVVLLDGAGGLRRRPGVARLLEHGPTVGLRIVCLDTQVVALPAECAATVEITGEVATRSLVTVRGHTPVTDVVTDCVGERWATRFARSLAPLRDATPGEESDELPPHARLLDLLAFDATDPAALETAWRVTPRSTEVVLGAGPDGAAYTVDLRRDGPHVLVAGTTGSGKSELLQTLVAGLAVVNRPDEMSFVLIDYKGGAAFKECARLPHTVGCVTDLDGHLTERALASLTAELRRREAALRVAGCKDLDDYLAEGRAAGGPVVTPDAALPRLVLVVDEFATLAEELPDFVGGLVSIAQRGRSLGVHLVLATQRPAGVVSANIRANTSLRIALRVTDQAESMDVVDVRDAASISRTTPGRAVVRIGAGPVSAFQTARVSGHAIPARDGRPRVRPCPWADQGDPAPRQVTPAATGPSDLARLVDSVTAAADRLGARPADSPWLPALRAGITLDDLAPGPAGWGVPLGLTDLPDQQRQASFSLDLEHGGNLLVAGGPRSGRSTVLRTLAASIASRFAPTDVHLYVVDGGGGALTCLAPLPHCGAAVGRDQTARGDRLLTRLTEEMERRQALLAVAGLGSVAEQRSVAPPEERLPWIVLLVDGWEGVQAAYESVDHGRPLDTMTRLAREGVAAGLRVVVTGGRGLVTSRLGSAIADRLLLRLADPADYGLAGIPARLVPRAMPPGRGLLAADAVEVQTALIDRDPSGPAQVAALARIGLAARSTGNGPPIQRPIRVEPLPARIGVDDVRTAAKEAATSQVWALLGVGGDELGPVGVDLAEHGPAFVVAGPPGSGRSTALTTMARWFGHQGLPVVLVAHRHSPLRTLAGEPGVVACLGPDEEERLQGLLSGHGNDHKVAVLADDAEMLHDTPVERPLLRLLRPHTDSPAVVVLAGSTTDMAGCYRGLTVEARRGRCGLLLGPTGPVDGDLLGVRVQRTDETRPGRGVLVLRGRQQPLQVAIDTP